jgi:o-succinylbenzoate synthase
MTIASADVRAFRLVLRPPLLTASARLDERCGYRLTLADTNGLTGYGEASPVWWGAGEALEVVRDALMRVRAAVAEGGVGCARLLAALGRDDLAAAGREGELVRSLEVAPAARSAVECALLDLEGRRRGLSVAELLRPGSATRVEVNALATASDPGELATEVAALVARGYRTVKIKIGALSAETDARRMMALREAGGGSLRLRLDANGAWGLAEATEILGMLAGTDIDYVEDPLASPSVVDLCSLRQAVAVPIALDEPIATSADVERYAAAGACDVVVLKLARLGGPIRALDAAERALAMGLAVTFTDSIEGEVGRAATAHTAAALPGMRAAVGLGGSVLAGAAVRSDAPSIEVKGPGLGALAADHVAPAAHEEAS